MRASRTKRLRLTPASAARSDSASTTSGSTQTDNTDLVIPNSMAEALADSPSWQRQFIEAVRANLDKRLIINMPRQHGRSTLLDMMDKSRREP